MRREISQQQQFDEAFRQWAARPVTSGAEAAATLFVPRERHRRFPRLSPAWATLASAALVIASATAWWLRAESPAPRGEPTPSRLAAASTDSDVVIVWLDDQTPVQVFLTDRSARGAQ